LEECSFRCIVNKRNNYSVIEELKYIEETGQLEPIERRRINYLLQLKREAHGTFYNFIHFSFYEFFSALSVYSGIKNSIARKDTSSLLSLFKIDLSFPVRHYLIDLIASDTNIKGGDLTSFFIISTHQ
jgi:hypothetical protein